MKSRAFALMIIAVLIGVMALAGMASDIDNCCFVDRSCQSDQQWIDGYWAFQNNQCNAPASSQPAGGAPAQVDNCCFVDRQCSTDQEWVDGWQAYQNNQCGAPPQSQSPASSQSAGGAPAQIDNCCFVDRQCHSDQDWADGYWAFQNNQCGAPPQSLVSVSSQPASGVILRTATGVVIGYTGGRSILPTTATNLRHDGEGRIIQELYDNCCENTWQCNSDQDWAEGIRAMQTIGHCSLPGLISIVGDPDFVTYYEQRLDLLKNRLPQRYDYVLNYLNKIEQFAIGQSSTVDPNSRIFYVDWHVPAVNGWDKRDSAVLVHEACHIHRNDAGFRIPACDGEFLSREEVICMGVELEVLHELDAPPRIIEWLRGVRELTRAVKNPFYLECKITQG